MSHKKTKPPAKSEKGEQNIRSSPATRALRFLLGKEHDADAAPDLAPEVSADPPISAEIEIEPSASSDRAGSNLAGSDSQLTKALNPIVRHPEEPLPSQLKKSRLIPTQLPQTQPLITDTLNEAAAVDWRKVEHTRIPQVVFDEILPKLPPMAQMPYLQLLRLTLGFQRACCHISLETWAARCNQSLASIKRQALLLQQHGLLRKETVVYGGAHRGSYYRPVIPGILNDEGAARSGRENHQRQLPQSQLSSSLLPARRLTENNMKRDHEDHVKETDHHESLVMRLYEDLTGNRVTGADRTAYGKIAHLSAETVTGYMRQIYERAAEPIGSFAYFTKAIEKATAEGQRTRAAQKRNLERIIERIRQNRTGGRATIADLIEEIKRACARDNVVYNTDLVNEILGL